MPQSKQTYNTVSEKFDNFRSLAATVALLTAATMAGGGCRGGGGGAEPQAGADGATHSASPKKKPLPWLTKPAKVKPTQPDETWITDLKALSPREVVRRYLTLSVGGDLTKVKPLVVESCHKGPIGQATATRAFGARIKIKETTVELVEEKDGTARVRFTVEGSIQAKGVDHETDILGRKVKVKVATVTVAGLRKTGELTLQRKTGRWQVACPKLPPIKAGIIGEKPGPKPHIPHLPGLGGSHEGHGHEKAPPRK